MGRNQLILVVVVLLVIFNIYQWWPSSASERAENRPGVVPSQLNLHGTTDEKSIRYVRDLFYLKEQEKSAVLKKESVNLTIKEDRKPVKNLAGLKLLGVIYKNNRYEAFVKKGEDYFKLTRNKKFANRYQVKMINIKSIQVKDLQTGRLHDIQLSDG